MYAKARYCVQRSFDLLTYSHNDISPIKLVKFVNCKNEIENFKHLRKLEDGVNYFKACYCNGSVFVVSSNIADECMFLDKYCSKTNSWINVALSLNFCATQFSVCAYLKELYLFGGYNPNVPTEKSELNDCFRFNIFSFKSQLLTPLNLPRCSADCAVFEGKIVISGGHGAGNAPRSVEAFDFLANKWSFMPNMVEERFGHSLLAVRNKLFAIRGSHNSTSEVYDSFSKEFVLIKSLPFSLKFNFKNTARAITMGNKIIIF